MRRRARPAEPQPPARPAGLPECPAFAREALAALSRPGALLWADRTTGRAAVFLAPEMQLVRVVDTPALRWLRASGALAEAPRGRLGRRYTLSARGAAILAAGRTP